MSYMDEYNKLKKKRLEEEAKASAKKTNSGVSSYVNEYNKLKAQRNGEAVFNSNTIRENLFSTLSENRRSFIDPGVDNIARKLLNVEAKETESKKEKEEDDSKLNFFQKGSFEDGYQRWDVSKAILGTVGDAGLSVVKGIGRLGEGIGDLVSYGVAGVADLVGKDEFAEDVKKRTQESVVDLIFKDATDSVNKNSVLGRTSDAILEGIGQYGGVMATGGLGAAAGLGTVGTTALTTAVTGLSGVGSGMGESYKGGATDWEALKHGLNVGATDAISELIFGGLGKTINAIGFSKGLSSADDIVAKALSSNFKKQITKNIVEFGVKSGAEGLEEVLAGVAQAYSKYNTYMSDEEFLDILKDENLLEQFVVGAFTSGIAQAPSLHVANSTKTDFVTGRTQNEQSVVDKEVENRIAEKEKNGTKLTAKEKSAITAQVENDLEKGYIDTDTIESVLGGESYKGYQSMVERETALNDQSKSLTDEINTLLDKENPTMRDSERLADARKELEQVKSNLESLDIKTAKSNLFSEVDKLTANDTKLRESYNEKARRGQAFEADLTKYDAKQQETIKKAVESGILNNTNRTHEFVDLVAKISADTGVHFDFTNNQKLKESGFAIDGKQVNGFVTKDGVTLNVQSAKSLDTVVGHEITHVLEGTELYTELQTAVVEYAKSKNDYQGRYDSLTKLYENIEGANIDSELTAELVGDYIFTDTDFIHNLSTNHRNVFQKIYDEVKYLYKVATAGSKEARELERVKKLFDEAYRGATKNTADSGVQYSIGETTDGRFAAVVDNDILSNIDTSSWDKATKKKVQKAASEELKKFSDGFTINGIEYVGNQESIREYTRSNYSEALANHEPNAYLDKMRASAVLDDVIQVATEWKNDNGLKHDRDDYVDFVRGNTLIKSGDKTYRAVVLAGITSDGKAIFHDVVDVNPEAFEIKKSEPSTAVSVNESPNNILEDSDEVTVAQEDGSVKGQFPSAEEVTEAQNKQRSLSEQGNVATTGKFLGKDMALESAPVAETTEAVEADDIAPVAEAKVEDYAPGESLEEQLAKADESLESLDTETEVLFRDLSEQRITDAEFAEKWKDLDKRFTQARAEQERLNAEMTDINNRKYESLDDSDIPPEAEAPYYGEAESVAPVDPFAERDMYDVGKRNVKAYMHDNPEVKPYFQDAARAMLFDLQNGTKGERIFNEQLHYESGYEEGWMGTSRRTTSDIADLLDQWGYSYAQIEAGLNAIIEGGGKENNAVSKRIEFMIDNRLRNGYKDVDGRPIPADEGYINLLKEKQIDDYRRESFDSFMEVADQYAPPVEDVAPVKEVAPAEDVAPLKIEPAIEGEQDALDGFEQEQKPERLTRAKLHKQIVDGIKAEFNRKGLDLDEVLKNAKRMNALSINDNTPQRVNDKTFGYEAGEALNELTFNRVALRESNGVKWLNNQVDTIKNLSKKYKIKPLSKESAAAQMYAEGFWVNDKDEIIAYGDAELAQDFPDVRVQNRIKALASDPTIRKMYDDTLSAINESRTRNGYPEIPRLENYYLHFRAMDDTFSRLGVPFNPNDIKAKDLPTDINGTTIDRKPGQPFFASSMHREGKRTSFDLFGGLEKYLNSAKNQIYHIDDIQTTRALWGYIADRFGQAHGLENLDHMELEAQQEHIQQVYDGHLSNYARFLVEYANNLAGKTALIDRGVEGLIGRRALQFINTVNMQTSRNQVGYSISSPLTNFIPSMEAIARTSKRDSIKAFAQTVSNVFRKDGFVENDLTLIRRRGTDKFAKTLWEKMSDPGFILMQTVDNVTSEFIVRTKYNELTRKGMDSAQAHIKAGEWASRIMGDRSLGQMPLHYNSKFMGLFTKYQLEVRNALDSQFYDTFQEAKANTKDIENQKSKNALTATKFAYRAVQIAALNHVFGMAFEKIAGYNPAFDIISTIATLFGWDDEEDDDDTFGDNAEQAFKELLGDLPYTSLFTDGGRIPIGSAMPIKQLISGVDKYGNEKSRLETLAEAAPYYLLPGGYGQIKKTTQGLGMFSEDHPVSGSYTDSGNLRFPVEKTFGNVLQAGVFGQYASENARDYFDNERSPLKEKQIQEYIDVDIPIKDYWDYREGLAKLKTNEDKVDYIDSLDLPLSKKNILVNNVLDRKEDVDLADYGEYGSLAEFDFAVKYPEKYRFFEEIGITYDAYSSADDDSKDAYNWAFQNPDKYTVSKAISDDVVQYKSYTKGLSEIEADKDENGKSINGSRKEKVFNYIESLPLDYGQKCILFKSQYKADDSMNMDIIEYLDSREDIDYNEMVTILKELDFTVEGNNVYWD